MKNQFYVAADRIQDGSVGSSWRRPSFEAAVDHARLLMERDGGKTKYIVKIVAVVEREVAPVKVKRIK